MYTHLYIQPLHVTLYVHNDKGDITFLVRTIDYYVSGIQLSIVHTWRSYEVMKCYTVNVEILAVHLI